MIAETGPSAVFIAAPTDVMPVTAAFEPLAAAKPALPKPRKLEPVSFIAPCDRLKVLFNFLAELLALLSAVTACAELTLSEMLATATAKLQRCRQSTSDAFLRDPLPSLLFRLSAGNTQQSEAAPHRLTPCEAC